MLSINQLCTFLFLFQVLLLGFGCNQPVVENSSSEIKQQDGPANDTTNNPVKPSVRQSTSISKTSQDKNPTQNQEPSKTFEAAFVSDVANAIDLSKFPTPDDADQVSIFGFNLHYRTRSDFDTTIVTTQDELLKRGFKAGPSYEIKHATVTFKLEDVPGTIYLASCIDSSKTLVTIHHHQGVDVSMIPALEIDGTIDRRVDQVRYFTPLGVLSGKRILEEQLRELNVPVLRESNTRGTIQIFHKNGMRFACNVEQIDDNDLESPGRGSEKYCRVSINSFGNTDLTQLPRPNLTEELEQHYGSIFGSYQYITKSKARETVALCEKHLTDNGWRVVTPVRESAFAELQLLLIKNGSMLMISSTEFENGRRTIQYIASMLPFDIPTNIETRLIRVDTGSPRMFFATSAPALYMANFYDKHLNEIGWKADPNFRDSNAKHLKSLFRGKYYNPLLVDINIRDENTTWVELMTIEETKLARHFADKAQENDNESSEVATEDEETDNSNSSDSVQENITQLDQMMREQMEEALKDVPPEMREETRKMFMQAFEEQNLDVDDDREQASSDSEDLDPDSPLEMDEVESEDAPEQVAPEGTIAAEAFPIPDGAQKITRDVDMITFGLEKIKMPAKHIEAALKELGWKYVEEPLIEDDMAIMEFEKDGKMIRASMVFDDRRTPPVHSVVQGDGLWFPDSENDMAGDDEAFDDDFGIETPTEFEGLTLPDGIEYPTTSGSQFRQELETTSDSDLKTLYDGILNSAEASGWQEKAKVHVTNQNATIMLSNDSGSMEVKLLQKESKVSIKMVFRNPELAKQHGLFPEPGKARLVLANASENEITITIDGKAHQLKAEQGANDPKDGILLDYEPGKITISIKGPNRKEESDELELQADGAWGLIVLPEEGYFAEQMY